MFKKVKATTIILIIIVGSFITKKIINSNKSNDVAEIEHNNSEAKTDNEQKTPETGQNSLNQEVETKTTDSNNSEKIETTEEKYLKQGYIQDPDNANQLMKKEIDKNGNERILYVNKHDDGFEPTRKTIKNAIEVLEMKRGLNPVEEISNLKPLDENLQENLMLMGNFRDAGNDLEIFFSPITDPNGTPLGEDMVCFISPKLKINIPKKPNQSILRADETGYAIVKFNDALYARFTWSYEKKRTLHGDILSLKNGAFHKTSSFVAEELSYSKGEVPKYCN